MIYEVFKCPSNGFMQDIKRVLLNEAEVNVQSNYYNPSGVNAVMFVFEKLNNTDSIREERSLFVWGGCVWSIKQRRFTFIGFINEKTELFNAYLYLLGVI